MKLGFYFVALVTFASCKTIGHTGASDAFTGSEAVALGEDQIKYNEIDKKLILQIRNSKLDPEIRDRFAWTGPRGSDGTWFNPTTNKPSNFPSQVVISYAQFVRSRKKDPYENKFYLDKYRVVGRVVDVILPGGPGPGEKVKVKTLCIFGSDYRFVAEENYTIK